ncbi:monofunctional biosynthetic peptidoglycan transglycosylase [Actinobacillus equuli]|nr:monofunctional biosynthetic peptidoglycan transglycosylase [Actinobacillus equuli]
MVFSVLPVPFSAYMAQKKVEHLISGDNYKIQYDWVSLDKIAWQMQMAVIASEDQKFESHFGIDLQAIEIALQRNAKSKKVRGASTISQQTVKNMFCGTDKVGYERALNCR